jgi:uncharacterized protein (DUF302 family)
MIYKIKTKTALQTVKDNINKNSKEYSFGVLGSYDFKKVLESKGFPIEKEISVYEVCNPEGGQDVLTHAPEAAAFLPCRISVYAEGAETIISTIDISILLNAIKTTPALKEHIDTVYGNLVRFMKSL